MTIKQRALDATTPQSAAPGRYQPNDKLLAFLKACDCADPRTHPTRQSPTTVTLSLSRQRALGIVARSG
jgi:hypothetical protein